MEFNRSYHRCIQEFKPHLDYSFKFGEVWVCPYCNRSWTYIYSLTDVPRIKWKNTEWTKNRGIEMARIEIKINADVTNSLSQEDLVSGILMLFKDIIQWGSNSMIGTVTFTGPNGSRTYELNSNGYYNVQNHVKVW